MGKIFSMIGQLFIVCALAYFLAFAFDYLPAKFTPENLIDNGYKNFKAMIAHDASSDSFTSAISKNLQSGISNMEKSKREKEKADAEAEEKEMQDAKSSNPLTKAREATEQYEKQIQEQKKILDSI